MPSVALPALGASCAVAVTLCEAYPCSHKKEAAYKAASAILFGSENAITGVAEARDNITMVI